MPACFQLIDKATNQPAYLQKVDDAMREAFNASPDAKHWYRQWYDCIGFSVATGKTLDQCREIFDHSLDDVIDWIDLHYSTDCFYQHK